MWSIGEAARWPARVFRAPSISLRSLAGERRRRWLSLLGLGLLVKVLVIGLTVWGFGNHRDPLTTLGTVWDQWDAKHYLYLATHGYSAQGDARNLIAFFPLYPALISAVATLGLPVRLAALLISNLAGLIAAILLYEVARHDQGERAAWRAAALFTVFPTAYFLLVGYTEALFCALAFGAVLAARRQRWTAAGLLGGLAAATRVTGLALVPFLIIEIYQHRRTIAQLWRAVLPPLVVLVGFGAYLATNLLVLGDPFAFLTVQREHWSHRLAAPWVGFATAIKQFGRSVPWLRLTVGGGEIAGALAVYASTTLSWLRLRPADAAYATAVTVMVTFLPFWVSIPRYLLGLYPLFLLAGRVRVRWLQSLALAVSFFGLIVFSLAFAGGYWAF